ncbi:MAG: NAD-dependent epimerase/dehydratase family protein [Anaerolineae bacterium]
MMMYPDKIASIVQLEDILSQPSQAVVSALRDLSGDLLILGAGGKMGPTLAMMARRALDQAGGSRDVIAVSRFNDEAARNRLTKAGVKTIACDLLEPSAINDLPDVQYIIYMAGMKFGASQTPGLTWALNAYMPGLVAARFPNATMVVFSSGNVYPFTSVVGGGCDELTPPAPVGEYAMSVLGRERVFGHFSQTTGLKCLIFRLNYAVELRYGVLLDIAQKVWRGEPIDLAMGSMNAIWQGDANAIALRCLALASSPPRILNVTGPETLSVRALANTFGRMMNRDPQLAGCEQPEALFANSTECQRLFGYPQVPIGQVMAWVAEWVKADGATLGKPTKFAVRDGHY